MEISPIKNKSILIVCIAKKIGNQRAKEDKDSILKTYKKVEDIDYSSRENKYKFTMIALPNTLKAFQIILSNLMHKKY